MPVPRVHRPKVVKGVLGKDKFESSWVSYPGEVVGHAREADPRGNRALLGNPERDSGVARFCRREADYGGRVTTQPRLPGGEVIRALNETSIGDVRRVREKRSKETGNDANTLADRARQAAEKLPEKLGLKPAKE